jgi:hypothetical protein
MKSAEQRASDELLAAIPEADIVHEMAATLTRARRWYLLHKRPIVATDINCYINAFNEILVLDALPDVDTSKSVN